MRVGSAGCVITPDRPLLLEGYGSRDRPAEGTLDPLEARAIVFDDGHTQAAILTVDVCGLVRASTQRIRALVAAACAIAPEHILVTYSHTHSAPATTTYVNQPPDPTYLAWLERTLADLVTTAQRRLQPALLAVAEGQADFNVNRRLRTPAGVVMRANPYGLVDRRVRLLRFDPADAPAPRGSLGARALPQANPLALLFSYVCHPTVLGGTSYRYSSDYPGAARRFVERAFCSSDAEQPACLAGFLPGCFGNVRPHLLAPDGRFREGTPHELSVLGRRLGSAVVQAAETTLAETVERIAMATREVTLPYASLPTAADLRAALNGSRRYWAQALLDRLEREGLPDIETTEVQVLRLGRHWLVGLPGETTLEIGLAIERSLIELGLARPDRGDMTLSIGYANDYVAYLPSASLMTEGGYEVTSWYEYLRCGPFTADLEGRLVQAVLSLAQELGARQRDGAALPVPLVTGRELMPPQRIPYVETFDDGPGGWSGWRRHHENVPLAVHDGAALLRSPWGVDSNHAPPGAGYLSLLAFLYTVAGRGPAFAEPNRFVAGGHSRDLTNATVTLRVRGNVSWRGAALTLLVQAHLGDTVANFILTGGGFRVTRDWSEPSVVLAPESSRWTCIGARHDMRDQYGYGDIATALRDVNNDIILVLFPLTIVPLEPRDDLHRLRPEHDYGINRRYLPEGEIELDTISITYPARSGEGMACGSNESPDESSAVTPACPAQG